MQNVLKHAFERSTRWADFWPGYGHANCPAKTEPKVKIVQDNSLIISITIWLRNFEGSEV